MKLELKHIEWLERNDGKYDIISDCSIWYNIHGEPIRNVMRMTFNETGFNFNPGGLASAIDAVLDVYPNS